MRSLLVGCEVRSHNPQNQFRDMYIVDILYNILECQFLFGFYLDDNKPKLDKFVLNLIEDIL